MQACRKPSRHKSILDFPGGASVPWTTAGISIHHSDNFPPWYHYSGQRFYMKFTILNIDLMVLNIYLSIILGMVILRYMYFFFGQFSLSSFFCVSLLALHRKSMKSTLEIFTRKDGRCLWWIFWFWIFTALEVWVGFSLAWVTCWYHI